MKTADAVVIGAGINGAATAYNLQRRGLKTLLIEKRHVAGGGTGRSAAIIRQHYSNDMLVKMVKRSVDIFTNFDDEIGGDPGFMNTGWAFLVPDYVDEGFSSNIALAHSNGVDVREISKQDLHAIEPRVCVDDVHRIAYEPGSGYCDPCRSTYAYVKRFRDLGGTLLEMTAVTGLTLDADQVTGVEIGAETIETPAVVNAAGYWAKPIAAWAGIDLPLEVTREEELVLETGDVGGGPRLCFSDMALAIYYRPHGKTRTLVGRGYPKDYETVTSDDYEPAVRTSFIEEVTARMHTRWPGFRDALVVDSYIGLYDVTPDWHPVLGAVDGVDGFYQCAGFSGHGFKIAPSVGEVMAELICDATTSIDIRPLRLSRFAEGDLVGAAYGANRA